MPKLSYGSTIEKRAWTLLSVLIERAGQSGVQMCQMGDGKPYLKVEATLETISTWATQSDSNCPLAIEQIRLLLTQNFGQKFLGIMTDLITERGGPQARPWRFKITIWSKNKSDNESYFASAWSVAKENQQSTNSSQVLNSSHQISCEERYDVLLYYDEEDKNIVKEIEEKLSREGIKVRTAEQNRCPGQSNYKEWEKQSIEQCNSIAVFVGSHDSALWQDKKKLSFLNKFYKSIRSDAKKRFPIPVLLPNAPLNAFEQKSVPRYLKGDRNAVDFTQGVFTEKINDLIYGITGEDQSKKQKFLTLISHNHKDLKTDQSTEVIIPVYAMKALEPKNETEAASLPYKATENLLNENKNIYNANLNDVNAYTSITHAYNDNNLPMPDLIGNHTRDGNNLGLLEQKKQKEKNHILIGLSTHILYLLQKEKSINSLTKGQYFYVGTTPDKKSDEKEYNLFWIKCGRFYKHNELSLDTKWSYYKQNKNKRYDYAIFAKFAARSKTIMVYGGLTAIATERLALYFRDYWEKIYDKLKDEKGGSLNPSDAFAVVIEIPGVEVSDQELELRECKIVEVCINKNP
ncbi:hypothetical protein C7B62_06600 [Pleurocapsa sp. CCALA 161]|uniref:TIR domain-containing protein n=1 Tax=Pleurocapsa sp. CCALA 161 TaxID=2107688 RepID=UPI000D057BE7|nr:TIR domain-containing protein [Pleurocapsa sp. CCALA 161]PSB11215.1 hypothetical protein C7B62_06600 [Pleurocapsa sp. CCALA 161]